MFMQEISGMTHETLKWKLFPFSLSEEAKQWYIRVVGCVNGSWVELRNRFCSVLFPLSRTCSLRAEILNFHQNDKELIGVACARFTLLVQSGPDLSLPEHLLFQHFYTGLDKEFAHHLNLTSRGSFGHLTPTEGREVLNRILEKNFFHLYPQANSSRTQDASKGNFRYRIGTYRKPITRFDP